MRKAGDELFNPVTGQRLIVRRSARDTAGQALEVEAVYPPGSPEPAEHLHPEQEERFRVLEGTLTARVGGQVMEIGAGGELVVAPGVPHAMWNAGSTEVRTVWETIPALRTEQFFETVWALGQQRKVNAQGIPGLLQAAVLAGEFSREFRLTRPPLAVQRIAFAILAPIGRLLGYRAVVPYRDSDDPA